MNKWLIIPILLWSFALYLTTVAIIADRLEPRVEYIAVPEYYPVQVLKEVPVEVIKEIQVYSAIPIEFSSLQELEKYVRHYRNNLMVEYGRDQCEDYAYDFMFQALRDGYLVSTEIEQIPGLFSKGVVWHLANTAPIGNEVYLIDICPGTISLYVLKD